MPPSWLQRGRLARAVSDALGRGGSQLVVVPDDLPVAVASSQGGSSFQLTIFVDDTDAICAELAGRGVALLNGPMDGTWKMRTASFADPDGHIWEVAQEIRRADVS